MAKIISLNVSKKTGTDKVPVDSVEVKVDHGIVGDAHARNWHRQISLLGIESIDKMIAKGLDLAPGAFAENITTEGIDLANLPIGTRLVSGEVEMEVTQIGKKCHSKCDIFHKVGDCVMPKEGIFVKVIVPGSLHKDGVLEIKPA
ncbi:MAG: MOSC domain-containing protein [Desulfobulbaceae bacterium]|nr:MOSC domain-containing protein [Desulfobulbaceae bacterium]HIJ79549.1 MOSC domain-containing protein [Deltaproteobacteria bacterium]